MQVFYKSMQVFYKSMQVTLQNYAAKDKKPLNFSILKNFPGKKYEKNPEILKN
jgi:hypothetical protein